MNGSQDDLIALIFTTRPPIPPFLAFGLILDRVTARVFLEN
jgi:hypothetical protein